MIQIGCQEGIVLDFFAGSSVSAQALFELNADDSGNRTFIHVQIPEAINDDSEANKAGYNNLCQIGKERIRRAGAKSNEDLKHKIDLKKKELEKLAGGQQNIYQEGKKQELQQEIKDMEQNLASHDYGFRVYRLDSSNMQDVYYRPQDYQQSQLDAFADNVKPDRTADDLLAQIILDWGLPLSLKINTKEILGKKVYRIAENSLYACFDQGIDEAFAKEIAKDKPLRVVFRDSGFKNDTAKVNVRQLLKQLSPETEMKVV